MSAPGHDSVQDLAAAYALGALSPDEAARFEAALAGSPELQREVAEYRDVAALLALAGPEVSPDAELRRRVVSGAGRPAGSRSRGAGPFLWGALAASVVALAGLGAALISARGEAGRLRTLLDRASAAVAERDATLEAVFAPGVRMFQLTASGDPDPGVQLFWDQTRNRAILHGYRLRPVPRGQAYQLWFIQDGKPVPSVTFRPEAGGSARVEEVQVPSGGAVSAAAVTIEPEAGSAQPTSPILMVGPLGKS
jgi:anti-sigma-K factor RskA